MPRRIALTRIFCLWAALFSLFISPLVLAEVTEPAGKLMIHNFDAETGKRIIPTKRCLTCHGDEKEKTDVRDDGSEVNIFVHRKQFEASAHNEERCNSCHTNITRVPHREAPKMVVECGDCHEDAQRTYFSSYHGQVNRLGYTNTAKCHDCHGGHGIKDKDDPSSAIHADNRLENCQNCHKEANENFISFWPHADANDSTKYPGLSFVQNFMQVLIFGVIGFFWVHVLLWSYRELMDRFQGKGFVADLNRPDVVYFRRFPAIWRWIHALFAISTMILILTGTSLLFSHTSWAKTVVAFLGGPEMEGIIHRTAAVIWLGIFLTHLAIAIRNIWNKRETFKWFGSTSMLPTWKDLHDLRDMFKWFFGRGSRPEFNHWTYWQKFDYWAPFWGAAIIGTSGLLLFMPEKTAIILPGWIFNIATLIHAEEALLAAIFLNSVHFFNVHFRPERFPMSTTIFTGAIPVEEFKHDHRIEYERLVESGQLENYLVQRPSRRASMAASFITSVLIMAGLALLTLVLIGLMTTPS